MERPAALVVDADATAEAQVKEILSALRIEVLAARGATDAISLLNERPVFLVLAAPESVGGDLEEFFSQASRARPSLVGVALLPEDPSAVARGGIGPEVFDAIRKPLHRESLRFVIERARAHHELLEELIRLREESRTWTKSARLAGRSETMERLRDSVARIAAAEANTLFVGEAGTGKELAARVAHELSARRRRPFFSVECSGVPDEQLVALLFGATRGPATPQPAAQGGAIEAAREGVLFLHEVADLPHALQERLARVVVDSARSRPATAGVRFLSATSRDLARAVAEGRFHEDLYHGLAAEVVHVPPLRERPGDASHLARRFIEAICVMNDLAPLSLSPEAQLRIERYEWPGNVEELRQAVEQAALLTPGGTIQAEHLPEHIRQSPSLPEDQDVEGAARRFRGAKRVVVESFEKSYLQDLMERQHGNVTAAAEEAGMLRSALQRLLRKYDLRSSEFRGRRTPKGPRQRL